MRPAVTVRQCAGFAWQNPFTRVELVEVLVAMREACGLAGVPLDVMLADDAFISKLNAAFLSCPGPTNILSFPPFACYRPESGAVPGGGILVLSLDALWRESLLYGQEEAEYALRLLAHGMSHLAGFDHGNEMDAAQEKALAAGRRAWFELLGSRGRDGLTARMEWLN